MFYLIYSGFLLLFQHNPLHHYHLIYSGHIIVPKIIKLIGLGNSTFIFILRRNCNRKACIKELLFPLAHLNVVMTTRGF